MGSGWRVFVLEKRKDYTGGEESTQEILQPNYSRNLSQRRYWITSIRVIPMMISPKLSLAVELPLLRSKRPGKT
jgi:hypothetical protein|tara:strand:+ start:2478 stop:2699 length:222 start_codon:yes stop_codon:yes gene_type:complete